MNTSLHNLIPDSELSPSLKKPLIFGDRKQIDALYDLEARIEEMETDALDMAVGLLKYYNVEIEYTGTCEVKVLAQNEADAKEKARDEAVLADIDMEEDFVTAREVKPCLKK
jgi:hypothetical protein